MNALSSSTIEYLKAKQTVYGNTWYLVGKCIVAVDIPFRKFVASAPLAVQPWIMILTKLIRIMFSPMEADHWFDIIGYATLYLEYLKEIRK